jgi:hypothetical protein
MKRNKVRKLRLKKERSLLSEMLPYEVPIYFSNKQFYEFIVDSKVELIKDGYIRIWKYRKYLISTFKLMFDRNNQAIFSIKFKKINNIQNFIENRFKSFKFRIQENIIEFTKIDEDVIFELHKIFVIEYLDFKIAGKHKFTKPFQFNISHKRNNPRTLSIPHIFSQLRMMKFYCDYKEVILYNCSKSKFSIRYPSSVADTVRYDDKYHIRNLGNILEDVVEQHDSEYDVFINFFTYKHYSRMYKFWEREKFQSAERKFNYLLKLDISKCFESIYSHTISWAVYGKEAAKRNISAKNNFPSIFDSIAQAMNHGETNGILIGPEFSRIFAEIILQAVDVELERQLISANVYLHKDYLIFRYVDDILVFYNNEDVRDKISDILIQQLKFYKLSINESKTNESCRPFISLISVAKNKLRHVLDQHIGVNKEFNKNNLEFVNIPFFKFSYKKIVLEIKEVIATTNIDIKDISSFLNSIIHNKFFKLTSIILEKKENEYIIPFLKACKELITLMIFLYNINNKMASCLKTIKTFSIILSVIKRFQDNKNEDIILASEYIMELLNKECLNVLYSLRQTRSKDVELIHWLNFHNELGKSYRLDVDELCDIFGINLSVDNFNLDKIGYFKIMSLLYYIRDIKKYYQINSWISDSVKSFFGQLEVDDVHSSSEYLLLLIDVVAYPYWQDTSLSVFLVNKFIEPKKDQCEKIVHFIQKNIFYYSNKNINFGDALETKYKKEVYN